jgi:hypothetical protein
MTERQLSPCEELRNMVTAYLEEVIDTGEREWFESHIEMCGSCDVHLKEMKVFVATLARCGPAPISPSTRRELHVLFQSWRAERARGEAPRPQ